MMRLLDLFKRPHVSPPPRPAAEVPSEEEIRRARLEAEALARRARALGIEVTVEAARRRRERAGEHP